MSQQPIGQARPEADPATAPRLKFGPGPTQDLSHDLAEAVLYEVWKTSPERFGNHVKKAMIRLWGDGATSSANGRHGG
jgi:hypothetical protein